MTDNGEHPHAGRGDDKKQQGWTMDSHPTKPRRRLPSPQQQSGHPDWTTRAGSVPLSPPSMTTRQARAKEADSVGGMRGHGGETPGTMPFDPHAATYSYDVTPVVEPRPSRGIWRRILMFGGISVVLLSALLLLVGLLGYYYIAVQLPSPGDLQTRSFRFASSQIYDRDGRLMWELMDPTAGRRTWVPLSRVAPYLQQATIATEDRFFYANVGVDPIAIVRAFYYNTTEGEIVSGASTITQQLAKNVLLDPEERNQQTLSRKIREAVLAMELNRRYPKDQILEIYLNQIYYGNLAYGIEAASQVYFSKTAAELTLPEAALLAGLPQSPAIYDPIVNPEAAKARQQVVLNLMVEAGYITPAQAVAAYEEELNYSAPLLQFEAPHFIMYVRELVEARYGPDLLYQEPGIRIHTTLDPRIQGIAEEEVAAQVDALRSRDVSNGAVVVLSTKTGEILAMVGSRDFNDESIDGQVNVALRQRQPGSAIKPLTYLAAFERGWTPATLIMDVPVTYPDGPGGEYVPRNYDDKFRGPVLVRAALANSLNVPALKTLEYIGIPALKEISARLGITTLTRDDYGLSLTLGGGEVTLLELSSAYQAIADGGCRMPPTAILRITDSLGRLIEEYEPPEGGCVLRPEHAYLVTNVLADNEARTPLFGTNSPLKLSRPAAVKTGTTNDYRDSWTIGYTPDIVVGVWMGNADNTQMQRVSGASGAAFIWHNVMERSLAGVPVRDFVRPASIVEYEICSDSGSMPSAACPSRKMEIFAQDQPPLGSEHDIHQVLRIDTRNDCVANESTVSDAIEERYFQVYPADGKTWAIEHGIEQPPPPCPDTQAAGEAIIISPTDGQTVQGVITIQGIALAANFSHYVVEYGVSWGPQAFGPVAGPLGAPVEGGVLAQWDTRQQPNGPYTLRVVVFDRAGRTYEGRSVIVINNPLPSATLTRTPRPETETPTLVPSTETATPTWTSTIPSETATWTPTLAPDTPTSTATPPGGTPSATPTATLVPTATVPATVTPTMTMTPFPSLTPTTALTGTVTGSTEAGD
jgi:1A family penicillin-binding protein